MKPLHFPLIRITIFFLIGILVSYYFEPSLFWTLCTLLIGVSCFILSYFKNKFFGYWCFALSFLIGLSCQVFHSNIFDENHYIKQIGLTEKQHLLEITLKEKLKNTNLNSRFVANINRFDNKKSCGKFILNIRKDSTFHDFQIGSIIKLNTKIYKTREINNPNQFDYGKYLENQHIYGQVYTDLEDVKISSKQHQDIWFYAAKFRNKIISNLEKNGFSEKELAVIVALILGQQQDISPDILQDYQFAGAIHILSVSGLHVGFIMLFISFVLKPLPNTKKGKFIKLLITIISLWIFGFIAGLAPAILRSVVMFSFFAVGKYMQREVNIFHTLLVSAFIILLFKPSFLFDVGFQLSYISLFFILWLKPLLAEIWQPKNKIVNYFWEIITVSFAAQIGAFPLSVFYFHQFPGLFFITNLIVLPLIGFIMAYGVVILILAFFSYVPHIPMKILEYSVFYLNKIIGYIASYEQFVIQKISLNGYMLWALYVLIIGIIIWFKKPSFNKLVFAFLSIIVFQISCLATKYHHQKQHELIVFNIRKNTIIADRNGLNSTIYSTDSILKNIDKNRQLESYLVGNFNNIKSKKTIPNLLIFKNKKILILDSVSIYPTNIEPDLVIISHSPRLNLERFLQNCKPKLIVADASNYKSYVKIWKSTCFKQNVAFHSIADKGFYRLK